MNEIPLHDLGMAAADLPLFVSKIETLDEVIQTPEPDRHTFYEVLWIKTGEGQHHIDFEGDDIRPNTLFFIAPGQIHFWNLPRPSTGYVLLFAEELFHLNGAPADFLRDLLFSEVGNSRAAQYINDAQAAAFDQLFERLLDEHTAQHDGWRTAMQALIQLVLIQARRLQTPASASPKPSASEALTRRFRALVEQQFARAHTVQPYARALSVTTGYLTEAVREATGLPAGGLIRRRIVLEAKRFLIHTDDTVETISARLCFKNSSYFSRFFHRETGVTPDSFRREFRKKYYLSRD